MKKQCLPKRLILGTAAASLLALSSIAYASGGHGDDPAAKSMTLMETVKFFVGGNDQFKSHHDDNYFEPYQKGQTPNLTVISCADSRVHTSLFGIDPNNNIFIIRNIGNQVTTSEGSVDYGIRHLPTKVLLIMGHSSCGAVKAAMGDYSAETTGIKSELDTLRPVIAADAGEEDFNLRWTKNVERNVDYQVKSAMNLYTEKVNNGELAVVGGVYDFNNNYGRGRGTLVITNVNGITEPAAIMEHPALKELSKAEVVSHVGSLAPAL
jgi:carbonic anhydrase